MENGGGDEHTPLEDLSGGRVLACPFAATDMPHTLSLYLHIYTIYYQNAKSYGQDKVGADLQNVVGEPADGEGDHHNHHHLNRLQHNRLIVAFSNT